MYISRCKQQDFHAVEKLLSYYPGKCSITKDYLNKRDVSVQVRNEAGVVIGFVWAGLMSNKTVAYIDKAVVHPDYHHKKVLLDMYRYLYPILKEIGVKSVQAVIRHDEYHHASATQALRMGAGADSSNYTYVSVEMQHIAKELNLGDLYG